MTLFFSFVVTDSLRHNSNQIMPDSCETASLGEKHKISNQPPGGSYFIHSKLASEKIFRSGRLKQYKCSYCSAIWSSKFQLMSHVSNCHGDSLPYICSLCGKGYHTPRGLALHIQAHEGRSFPCPLCSTRFSQKGIVKRHLQNIHNATQCSICTGIYLLGEEFNKHVLDCRPNT